MRELVPNSFITRIKLGYAYIYQDHKTETNILKSLYALEYLKHKAVFGLDHQIWKQAFSFLERKMAAENEWLSSIHQGGLQVDVGREEIQYLRKGRQYHLPPLLRPHSC